MIKCNKGIKFGTYLLSTCKMWNVLSWIKINIYTFPHQYNQEKSGKICDKVHILMISSMICVAIVGSLVYVFNGFNSTGKLLVCYICISCQCDSKKASGLSLPADLSPPCLLQLLWLLSWKPTPNASRPPSPLLSYGHNAIQAHWLCCSTGTLNLLLSARNLPPHP
jgi:hypothetical protein